MPSPKVLFSEVGVCLAFGGRQDLAKPRDMDSVQTPQTPQMSRGDASHVVSHNSWPCLLLSSAMQSALPAHRSFHRLRLGLGVLDLCMHLLQCIFPSRPLVQVCLSVAAGASQAHPPDIRFLGGPARQKSKNLLRILL